MKIESRHFQQYFCEFRNDFDFVSETVFNRLDRKAFFEVIVMCWPEPVFISIVNPDRGTM
jgi:hypothetical protein